MKHYIHRLTDEHTWHYICWLTDEHTVLYSSVTSIFLGSGTEEYKSTDEFTLFSCGEMFMWCGRERGMTDKHLQHKS
jgi:hypothetical protein